VAWTGSEGRLSLQRSAASLRDTVLYLERIRDRNLPVIGD
jgi:hypothetical protein